MEEILVFLNKLEKLKVIQRVPKISDNSRRESPAEHTWRMAMMGLVLHQKLNLKLDLLRALKLILVHDIVEIGADDVWIHDGDAGKLNVKLQKEKKAADEIYGLLPTDLGEGLKNLWIEYAERKTPEARFAYALDKLEVMLQRMNMGMKNWEKTDFNMHEVVCHWADGPVQDFPELAPFLAIIKEELSQQKI